MHTKIKLFVLHTLISLVVPLLAVFLIDVDKFMVKNVFEEYFLLFTGMLGMVFIYLKNIVVLSSLLTIGLRLLINYLLVVFQMKKPNSKYLIISLNVVISIATAFLGWVVMLSTVL